MSSIWTKHVGALWTHVGSACVADEASARKYSAASGRFMHKGSNIGEILARCNVTNPLDGGRDPNWNRLEVVYRRQSQDDRVTAKLIRVSNQTGGVHIVEPFCRSESAEPSLDEQMIFVDFHLNFDFQHYSYCVEIMVSRSQESANVGHYPSVSIVRLKEIPKQLDWEIRLDRLGVEDPNESSDEPYFVMLGFRSTFDTSGSTRVFWSGELDDDWAEGSEAGDEHDIPHKMGVVTFPNVRYVSMRDIITGTNPEIIGALAIAFESDTTPWIVIGNMIEYVRRLMDSATRELIEENSITVLLDPEQFNREIEEAVNNLKESFELNISTAIALFTASLADPDEMIGYHFFAFIATDPWRDPEFPDDEVEDGKHIGALLEHRFTLPHNAVRFAGEGAVYMVNAVVAALLPE